MVNVSLFAINDYPTTRRESMSKVIIGIHGLANKPEKNILEKGWVDAMCEGLNVNAGINATKKSFNFESVYWADVMYKKPDTKYDGYKKAKKGNLKRYEDGWFDTFRKWSSNKLDDVVDPLKYWFDIDKAANKVLEKKLKDLYIYYNDKDKREELRGIFEQAIIENVDAGNRIMVVSHSMGTIIAYDVLRKLGKKHHDLSIEHFVTLGSPLGLSHVKYKISKESHLVRTPSIVNKWTNLADRRDPVALDTHLSDDYDANNYGIKVVDDLVLNDWSGIHHKSYGYLRTPEFTDLLKKFI